MNPFAKTVWEFHVTDAEHDPDLTCAGIQFPVVRRSSKVVELDVDSPEMVHTTYDEHGNVTDSFSTLGPGPTESMTPSDDERVKRRAQMAMGGNCVASGCDDCHGRCGRVVCNGPCA